MNNSGEIMKINLLKVFAALFLFATSNLHSQGDYSKPKEVAQEFLDLCLAGKRFEASNLLCTEGSNKQIEILLMQMVKNDIPLVNDKCKYVIDSCKIDNERNLAECYYNKFCEDAKSIKKGIITLKKINDRWLVEYIWMRDKYL